MKINIWRQRTLEEQFERDRARMAHPVFKWLARVMGRFVKTPAERPFGKFKDKK